MATSDTRLRAAERTLAADPYNLDSWDALAYERARAGLSPLCGHCCGTHRAGAPVTVHCADCGMESCAACHDHGQRAGHDCGDHEEEPSTCCTQCAAGEA